ncbi:MAG: glyoxalase/bleomycin resistance/dioxygenase family protein [Rubrivivax sp.]|nr:glyoxalase/bleomycin resistance/dioxygenase family protein [Rubrivivax sp.]
MKRFHVHLHVEDLDRSIGFYSKLFAAEPARVEPDYAKWMLEDPRLNFAISTRGARSGVDHLGFQTDDAAELAELKQRAQSADLALADQGETTCCYARSEKHWVTDPQGIAWEHFHTLGNIAVFGSGTQRGDPAPCCAPADQGSAAGTGAAAGSATTTPAAEAAAGCCAPAPRGKPVVGIAVKSASACC